jgi:ribosomal protein L23
MPGQSLHVRKVEKDGKVSVYGKLFEKSESGYRDGEAYAKKTSGKIVNEKLKCVINKNNKTIKVFTDDGFPVKSFLVKGTSSLTKLRGTYKNTGSFTGGFREIIENILSSIPGLSEFIIDFDSKAVSKIEQKAANVSLILNAFDYNYLNNLFSTEKRVSTDNSLHASMRYLSTKINKYPPPPGKKGKELSDTYKRQIFIEVLNNLEQNDLAKLVFEIYNKYFETLKTKIELFKKTDTYKLEHVLNEFDRHFTNYSSNEKKWQEFFEEYLRVINPSYKYVIREVDTIFNSLDIEASSRPIDFIVVDIYNNIELIELKTPDAPIVATKKDRNNYCLTYNCSKACTQIEKYLISLESNKVEVEKLIKHKISKKYGVKIKDINLVISKPKAKLIIGMIKALLTKPARHSDFQLQRHSFKNIEIIAFDEIYNSLKEIHIELNKNLKKKA